jgi:hypothetical protein
MSWGWHNGWPFQWGSGTTFEERAYLAMRDAMGRDGAGPEDASIEDAWRRERAKMLGACMSAGDRAAAQAHPGIATDFLGYYETLLAIGDDGAPIAERNAEALRRFTTDARADGGSLLDRLLEIDPRFEMLDVPREATIVQQPGRVFEDFAATLPFNGGRTASNFALVSTEYHVHARLPVGPGAPSADDLRVIERAARLLHDLLPAWVAYRISTGSGFILDSSALDVTGFDP